MSQGQKNRKVKLELRAQIARARRIYKWGLHLLKCQTIALSYFSEKSLHKKSTTYHKKTYVLILFSKQKENLKIYCCLWHRPLDDEQTREYSHFTPKPNWRKARGGKSKKSPHFWERKNISVESRNDNMIKPVWCVFRETLIMKFSHFEITAKPSSFPKL